MEIDQDQLADTLADVSQQEQQAQAAEIRNNIQFAVDSSPDAEARVRKLASDTSLPIDAVRANPTPAVRQAAVANTSVEDIIRQTPTLAKFLQDMSNARLVHDDIPTTAGVEQAARAIANPNPPAAQDGAQPQQELRQWNPSIGQRVMQQLRDWFGVTDREKARAANIVANLPDDASALSWDDLDKAQQNLSAARSAVGGMSDVPDQFAGKAVSAFSAGLIPDASGDAVSTGGQIAGGLGSLSGFLAGLPQQGASFLLGKLGVRAIQAGEGASLAARIAAGASRVGVEAANLGTASAIGSAGSAIDSQDLGEAAGKVGSAALEGAATGAVFGAAGPLADKALGALGLDTEGLAGIGARYAAMSVGNDLVTGHTPWDDRPLGQKIFDYGLNAAFAFHSPVQAQASWFADAAKAELAAQDFSKLQALAQFSAASKLRDRDPAAFKQMVADAAEEGPIDNVYVDANTLVGVLNQEGISHDQLAETMPKVAAQLREGELAQTPVAIPIEDFATHMAGTPAGDKLMPDLMTHPDGYSFKEAQQFQDEQAERLKDEATRLVNEKAADDAFHTSRQQVYDDILGQIKASGRYSDDVAAPMAALVRDYYTVRSSQLGLMPKDLYDRAPLSVVAQSLAPAADHFAQPVTQGHEWEMGQRPGLFDLPDVPVTRLNGEELGTDRATIKKGAIDALKDAGKDGLRNDDTGWSLQVSKENRSKIAQMPSQALEALQAVGGIRELAKNAVLAESHADERHGNEDVRAIHRLYAPVEIGGKLYRAKLTVKDYSGERGQGGSKTNLHALEAVELERAPPGIIPPSDGKTDARAGQPTTERATPPGNSLSTEPKPELSAQPTTGQALSVSHLLDGSKRNDGTDWETFPEVGEYEQPARGAYQPDKGTIVLLKDADLTTFLHELGHHFLELDAEFSRQVPADHPLAGDFQKTLDWFGVKDAEAWRAMSLEEKRPYHEQFAQGFEKYLMEGKAPSVEQQTMFRRFRSWLISVYKSLRSLGVSLTPEIRGVMDRMIASEEQIKVMQRVRGFEPLFRSAEAAGMAPDEFARYQLVGAEATTRATEQLTARSIKDMQWLSGARDKVIAKIQRENAAKRREVQKEVTTQTLAEPVYQARDFLNKNRQFEINDDEIAEMFGFTNGEEMEAALRAAPPAREAIKTRTDQTMLERFGDLNDEEAINQAADEAIHNDARGRFIATEFRALDEATTSREVVGRNKRGHAMTVDAVQKAAEIAARGAVDAKQIKDIAPATYTAAEAKAARNAEKALAKNDLVAAANEKRAELLNNKLAKAALDAQDEIRKTLSYFRKFESSNVLGKIELDYREQIQGLLDQYDLRVSYGSGADLARRQSLRDWYAGQLEAGANPAISDKLMDQIQKTHYRELTLEDFRALKDAVKSIEKLGRLKQELLDGNRRRQMDELVKEAQDQFERLPQKEQTGNRGLSRSDKKFLGIKAALTSADASLLKMEQMLDWLDDHDPAGVFNRVVFKRISDAQTRDSDLRKDIAGKLRDLTKSMPKEMQQGLNKIHSLPELPDSVTGKPSRMSKSEILAMALNTGNRSNLEKLLAGEGWKEDDVWAALHRVMGEADWKFVQGAWDTVESLWPEIEAMERRLGNTAPPKVEAVPVATPYGTFRGGYYPLVYDPLRSWDVEQNRQRGGAQLFENNYVRATTPKGHTVERTENYARPLHLSLDVLPRHISQVIHDIAYREAVVDADKFMADPRVRQGIESTLGREYYAQVRPWLQAIANDKAFDPKGSAFLDKFWHWARTNATMVGLGYRATTMLVHGGTALSNSVGEIGMRWMASGVNAFARAPRETYDFVISRSGEMRNRMNEVDRDIRDGLREMELASETGVRGAVNSVVGPVKRFAYYGVGMLDMASAMPTWMGAYSKALHGGADEDGAIYAADKAVRNAHGAGGAKDLAEIQRGGEFQKLFTMFYSFWNHFYNRQRDIGRTVAQIPGQLRDGDYAGARRDFAMVLARSWFYFVIPQLIHAAIKPSADPNQSDDKNWASWAAEEVLLGMFSGVPVVRDFANSAITGRDYNATPAASVFTESKKSIEDLMHYANDEPVSDKWLKHAITTSGYAFGLPTGQAGTTAQFLWDLSNGQQDPQNLAEWYGGLVHGDVNKT